MTARTGPPFRADTVGGPPRSASVEAREPHAAGIITAAELGAVEDAGEVWG